MCDITPWGFLGLTLLFIVSSGWVSWLTADGICSGRYRKELIARDLAQYDPQTGKLKWLDGSDAP